MCEKKLAGFVIDFIAISIPPILLTLQLSYAVSEHIKNPKFSFTDAETTLKSYVQ